MAASNSTPAQKEAFAAALNAAMKARGLRPVDLIPITGSATRQAGQAAAQSWVAGKSEPLRAKVTELEQFLELEPGALSRHLGWLPVGSPPILDLEAAVLADERLSEDQKVIVLGIITQFLGDQTVSD